MTGSSYRIYVLLETGGSPHQLKSPPQKPAHPLPHIQSLTSRAESAHNTSVLH